MKLCIDPGHGNLGNRYDPGAVHGAYTEADLVLMASLSGKWVLNQRGIAIWMTRDDDSDPTPLVTRDDRAEAASCSHFISVHMDWSGSGARGTVALFRDETDKRFAEKILRASVDAFGFRNRGVKHESVTRHGSLAVMGFDGPACLIELGFVTSAGDRALVMDRDKRIKFWNLVAEALN